MSKFKLESIEGGFESPFVKMYTAKYRNGETGGEKVYDFISRNKNLNVETMGTSESNPVAAVAMLAVDPEAEKVLMISEFRMPANHRIIACPAGLIDKGESIEEAVARELREETGYIADKITVLPPSFSCAGLTDERVATAIVTVSGKTEAAQEADEDIEFAWYTYEEAFNICMDPNVNISARSQFLILAWVIGHMDKDKCGIFGA